MKPIAIFRHAPSEGPGYLADFLDARAIPWKLVRVDSGDRIPVRVRDFSALVFMGGPMSVNDDLPWISPVLSLIRDAYAQNISLLGHCLGGQLISKALGGSVSKNPLKEIGWGGVIAVDSVASRTWLGGIRAFDAFHWHGETFSLPPEAQLLLSGSHCVNQGYVLGNHLVLQCHIEMTETMAESLMVEMNCPPSGGRTRRTACGRMTYRMHCQRVNP
jgi:GMP synthase-like glutamine amidotransferase